MGLISTTKKAIRLLVGRRFTSGSLTDAQEAFTSTLDINASEVFSQQNLITGSSIPFSGSSQNGSIYSSQGQNILKYWYRHKLTPSNVQNDVWFFMNPTGSTSGVTPQIIQDDQQTGFVSNKYAAPSLANAVAEDDTPGYNVVLYKSYPVSGSAQTGSLTSGDKVSTNDYAFDYKTGVVQFDQNEPTASVHVYLTAYQYVGRTLDTSISTIEGDSPFRSTGSYHSTADSADLKISGSVIISGSLKVEGQTFMDSLLSGSDSLIVSGAMTVAQQTARNAIASASITIAGLGTFATPDSAGVIDLGDSFN